MSVRNFVAVRNFCSKYGITVSVNPIGDLCEHYGIEKEEIIMPLYSNKFKHVAEFCCKHDIIYDISPGLVDSYYEISFIKLGRRYNVIAIANSDSEESRIIKELRDYYNIKEETMVKPAKITSGTYPYNKEREYIRYYCDCSSAVRAPLLYLPRITKVIFNAPATIVMWSDGTKTVVKSGDYDVYDPEKGLALCIAKKALGNQGHYYDTFREWLPKKENKYE